MILIVGLGNPGEKYKNTRHNVGFMAVDRLAESFGFDDFKRADKYKSEITEGQIAGEKVLLAKPQTFMNLSGQAVRALVSFYRIQSGDLMIIYDDVEIPLGKMRVRPDGSSGGHNGIASVIQELATLEVPRIRIGIKPGEAFPGTLEDFVLGNLKEEERTSLNFVFSQLPEVIEKLINGRIEEVMQSFN